MWIKKTLINMKGISSFFLLNMLSNTRTLIWNAAANHPKTFFSFESVLPCTGKDLPSCVLIYCEIDTILLEGDFLGTDCQDCSSAYWHSFVLYRICVRCTGGNSFRYRYSASHYCSIEESNCLPHIWRACTWKACSWRPKQEGLHLSCFDRYILTLGSCFLIVK